LRVAASSTASQIHVTSDSQQVKAPAVVMTRANQTSLAFQVSADVVARQQPVTVTAMAGAATVQDTLQIASASQPVLTVPGRQMARLKTPIRFTVTSVDPTGLPVQLVASDVPPGASFDGPGGVFEWTPAPAQTGKYEVTFTATNAAGQSASAQVSINVTSGDPVLKSMEQMCSPGAVGSMTGSWLAQPGSALADPSGGSMDLDGTNVRVNGQYVPVLLASSTQVQFLCPLLDPGTNLEMVVETGSGVTNALSAVMQTASPWLFSQDVPSQNQGIVSFAGTTELVAARNPQVSGHPAQAGDEILIWGTGLGSSADISTTASVMLDGLSSPVESVTAVSGHAGVYAIRVRVPDSTTPGDAVPLQLQVTGPDGKLFSSNSVTVAVEQVRQ
jgi:uncharacterized protein (TIGR03437 family)